MKKHFFVNESAPAYRMQYAGAGSLTDNELICVLIGNEPDKASALLNDCNKDLTALKNKTMIELVNLGLTANQALKLIASFHLSARAGQAREAAAKITKSEDAVKTLRPYFGSMYEKFYLITLTRATRIIKIHKISEGGISGTVVDPKKIFNIALAHHASALILSHNHPSGNIYPSEADKTLTKKIKNAGTLLDIDILDHLIITDDQYYSFADNGEM